MAPADDSANPVVSVIIPVHNRAELCRQATESATAALEGMNAEVIVVDDGSDADGSDGDISSALSIKAGNVRPGQSARSTKHETVSLSLHRIARSGMPGHVRNVGVGLAGGRYLAFLDSDDLWYPDKIRAQLEELRATGVRMVHCRERWIRGGREISQRRHRHQRRGDIFKDALVKCIVGPSTFVIERALFEMSGGFRDDMRVAEDYELALRLLAFEPVAYVDHPLVEKRDHDGPQLSHMYSHIEGFRIRALGDLLADMLEARAAGESGSDSGAKGRTELRELLDAIDAVGAIHAENSSGRWFPRTRWGTLPPARVDRSRVEQAAREYARKCRIFANGASKRGRDREARFHSIAAERLENACYPL